MKTASCLLALVMSFACLDKSSAQTLEATPQALYVASLASTCNSCHGPQGRAVEGSPLPGLAGRPASLIVAQMKAFQSGARPSTVMHQLAKGYSDEQIQAIATYFAAQQP